jgi:hypothetical protein
LTHPCYIINVDWFSWGWSKRKISFWKKIKMAHSKKLRFSTPPILIFFSWKFQGLVLGLVGLIDAKDIDVAQPIWLWGCLTWVKKQPKNTKNAFFACFWAHVGQSLSRIGQATAMPFESINPTNPNQSLKLSWNKLRIGRVEN